MNILIASSIHQSAIEQLKQQHDVVCVFDATQEELIEQIRDREVLVFRSGVQITADVMASAPKLRLLVRAGSGIDNIDMPYVRQHGVRLVRIPGPGAKAVAELAFGLMIGLARHITTADTLTRQGRWAKYELGGYLLTGKVLGIIGAGNIGSRVGQLGAAWDMEVIGCVEYPDAEKAAALADKGIRLVDCHDVLSRSDFVSIHVPLKNSTRNLIDAPALAHMKPTAYLINMARGGVVDEEALRQALIGGRLRGAALDVHEREGDGKISPLADLPNVILTPHIGAMSYDSQREIGERVLQIIHAASTTPIHEPLGVGVAVA